jgi:DNA-binding winged helix-turn-helix (wHTH) protein
LFSDRYGSAGAAGTDGAIHVEPQLFDLLLHFEQNSKWVVSKDELIERVWKGRIVSLVAKSSIRR